MVVIPDGVLLAVEIESCAAFTIELPQKSCVFSEGVILHEVSRNDKAAVSVVCSEGQGFVHDLLGIPYGQRFRRCTFRGFHILKIKKGHLRGGLLHPFGVPLGLCFLRLAVK